MTITLFADSVSESNAVATAGVVASGSASDRDRHIYVVGSWLMRAGHWVNRMTLTRSEIQSIVRGIPLGHIVGGIYLLLESRQIRPRSKRVSSV